MKGFLKKKWHGIPVGIVSALLALVLMSGSVLAVVAYGFFKTNIVAMVEEAIFPSYGNGDDLVPYMIGDGNPPLVTGPVKPRFTKWEGYPDSADGRTFYDPSLGPITFEFTITAKPEGDPLYDASEFCIGEELVIPIALRNRSDVPLTIKTIYDPALTPGLTLAYTFETNTLGVNQKATYASFANLSTFTTTLAAHSGNFGSAQTGAQVLFVKVKAENTCAPGLKTVTFTLTRE